MWRKPLESKSKSPKMSALLFFVVWGSAGWRQPRQLFHPGRAYCWSTQLPETLEGHGPRGRWGKTPVTSFKLWKVSECWREHLLHIFLFFTESSKSLDPLTHQVHRRAANPRAALPRSACLPDRLHHHAAAAPDALMRSISLTR